MRKEDIFMEQVFDFREFVLMLLKKCKLALILLLIFGVLGAAFGYWRGSRDSFLSTSSATVALVRESTDPAALTNTMKDISSLATSDYFYSGIKPALKTALGEERYLSLFPKAKEPTLSKLKEIVKFYTSGNLLMVDVTSSNPDLAAQAGAAAMDYALTEVGAANKTVMMQSHGQITVDVNEQNGSSEWSEALKFGILGMAGGFALGILWIFFADVFSLKVTSANDLRKYKLPVLGELDITEGGRAK